MHINCLLFPKFTQLDLTGPFEVLSRVPDITISLVGASMEPVQSDSGLSILPTTTLSQAKPCDFLLIPGGPGIDDIILEEEWVTFTQEQTKTAHLVAGICTGSLLLGAAGVLIGKKATSHWFARDLLVHFRAEICEERCCRDGNIFTAGGVTSGIDLALQIVAILYGEGLAKQIQLQLEYDPAPPFKGGTPRTSEPEIVQKCREVSQHRLQIRTLAVKKAAQRLFS